MKILLQNVETGLYLSRGGHWINKPELALAFLDQVRAKDYSIYHRLPDTEVVVVSDGSASKLPPAAPVAGNMKGLGDGPVQGAGGSPSQARNEMGTTMSTPKSFTGLPPVRPVSEARTEPTGGKPRSSKVRTGKQPLLAPVEQLTVVEAKIDVGIGNTVFIRGQGGGLSWDKGLPLSCTDPTTWVWSTRGAPDKVAFKLLLNDQAWAKGEDIVVEAGGKVQVTPAF